MLSPPDLETIDRIVGYLRRARGIFFVTGAGMSAESGLPTYRGVGGLYEGEATEDGLAIEEMLSGDMFRARPDRTWKYLRQIENASRGAVPNRGHQIIAEMERHFPRVWTLTQNVDGFHRAAGSDNVIPIHGELHRLRCTQCAWRETVTSYADLADLPVCPVCSAIARPDVVLFGEALPDEAVWRMRRELQQGFDIVFSIGTTSVFPYIARPIHLARERDKPSVEINPGETVVSGLVRYRLASGAAEALEEIWARYNQAG